MKLVGEKTKFVACSVNPYKFQDKATGRNVEGITYKANFRCFEDAVKISEDAYKKLSKMEFGADVTLLFDYTPPYIKLVDVQ